MCEAKLDSLAAKLTTAETEMKAALAKPRDDLRYCPAPPKSPRGLAVGSVQE